MSITEYLLMARIDTSRAQTKTQRQAKARAKAAKTATAQARVNAARAAADRTGDPRGSYRQGPNCWLSDTEGAAGRTTQETLGDRYGTRKKHYATSERRATRQLR